MKREHAMLLGATLLSCLALGSRAGADATPPDAAAASERCATRLSIALVGTSADAALVAEPSAGIERLMATDAFHERFARFVNAQLNDAPGADTLEDAPYHLARHVVASKKPWSELFAGSYRFTSLFGHVRVTEDPGGEGLGYFRSEEWAKRYEGNEESGLKLATAYRILHNVVGLRLAAATNAPDADVSVAGREAAACRGCHHDSWYALDRVAAVLPRKGEPLDARTAPQEILGGKQIANDRELVAALVTSENFAVNACRLAFRFLYAREDNRCEGPILDRCVDRFQAEKTIQSALHSIAAEAGYCE